jgi:hypothetical protein
MRQSLRVFGFLFAAGLGLSAGLISLPSAAFAVDTVTLLDKGEPYGHMISDSGVLWVIKNRENFNTNYRLEAYSADGKMLDQVRLPHAMWSMAPAGQGSVMMAGMNPTSRLTNYTTARVESGRIRFKTTEIALGGFINFWIANIGGRHYFADMGGNPNDDQLGVPAQTIFASTGTNARYLSTRLRMPVAGLGMNNKMYLVSHEAMGSPQSSIVEVDPATQAKRNLITSRTAKFTGIKILPGTTDLVTSALDEGKILIIDSKSGSVRRELTTKGYTRDFDFIGNCVVAGDDETNIVEIFDLRKSDNLPFMAEEVNLPFEQFSGLRSVAVDRATGSIFVRSSLPCNPVTDVCDKEYNRVVTFGAESAQRVKAACQ